VNTRDAIRVVDQLITFVQEHEGYSEFEDGLFSFADVLNDGLIKEDLEANQ